MLLMLFYFHIGKNATRKCKCVCSLDLYNKPTVHPDLTGEKSSHNCIISVKLLVWYKESKKE